MRFVSLLIMAKYLLFILVVSSSCLALKYQGQKIWLFSKTQYMGNAPVDRDGKAVKGYTETLLCFIEISKNKQSPAWQTAWYKGVKYSVNILQVNQDSVIIGRIKNAKTTFVIKPGLETKLIRLELTEQGNFNAPKANGFVLEGILNNKQVYVTSDEPAVELAPVLMQ
ncbi:hypothetical protein [Mucilaginibacter flavidus]|uniref:hypothetical protein n=1 Tax=Mucilaginibacter flavidus TaxID=2949309 RepID=UPI002091EB6B|nr:hypothetical protein [Mucilaginibacter flavidus]MCO5949744.1 hypothetical protein [Mucilaginibacter flavidus]